MSEQTFAIPESVIQQVNTALNMAIGICLLHARDQVQSMIDAGSALDDAINGVGAGEV